MSWNYNETPEFKKDVENLNLSQDILSAIEDWAKGVDQVQTNRQKRYFCSPNNIFEIWTARIPDPDNNVGSSGGFRLVYFFNINENEIHLDKMEKRGNLGTRRERPRDQQRNTAYLEELKCLLLRNWDNEDQIKK